MPPQRNLPDAQTLATLVSNVTKTMCGITFSPAVAQEHAPDLFWRMATLPIPGQRPIRVALASSQKGCTALGAAMFSLAPDAIDESMIDDSLKEVLNMAAGQIKSALALDQALGLPKIEPATLAPPPDALRDKGVVLRSRGDFDLFIWISEGLG